MPRARVLMRKVMEQIPSIKSMMTPFPHLVEAGAPLSEAEEMMRKNDFRHLPVRERGKLIGLISVGDAARARAEGAGPEATVRDAGISTATTFELSEPLDRVLVYMAETHVECVLIVKNRKLAGIFTQTDACRCFAEFLLTIFPPKGEGDAA